MEWQPIETAPKDGTHIIVRSVVFQWSSDVCQHVAVGHKAVEARFAKGLDGKPQWLEWCGTDKTFSTSYFVPEGWIPLP